MSNQDEITKQAKAMVAKALRDSHFNAGEYSGISANGATQFADAIETLIAAKVGEMLEDFADRIQSASGIRP
jgi:hypothetical protein